MPPVQDPARAVGYATFELVLSTGAGAADYTQFTAGRQPPDLDLSPLAAKAEESVVRAESRV